MILPKQVKVSGTKPLSDKQGPLTQKVKNKSGGEIK